jgi:hypothetical protein
MATIGRLAPLLNTHTYRMASQSPASSLTQAIRLVNIDTISKVQREFLLLKNAVGEHAHLVISYRDPRTDEMVVLRDDDGTRLTKLLAFEADLTQDTDRDNRSRATPFTPLANLSTPAKLAVLEAHAQVYHSKDEAKAAQSRIEVHKHTGESNRQRKKREAREAYEGKHASQVHAAQKPPPLPPRMKGGEVYDGVDSHLTHPIPEEPVAAYATVAVDGDPRCCRVLPEGKTCGAPARLGCLNCYNTSGKIVPQCSFGCYIADEHVCVSRNGVRYADNKQAAMTSGGGGRW